MATTPRQQLKAYFVKGAIPTESNFAELIDGMLNMVDDGIAKLPDEPLRIEAVKDNAGHNKLLNFFGDAKLAWTLDLNPLSDPTKADSRGVGLSISDASGHSRLFIDQATGNVGIGTVAPQKTLDVRGDLSVSHAATLGSLTVDGDVGIKGILLCGTFDGSQAQANQVVGAIGFYGFGQQHGQLSFRVGHGFEMVDRSADAPDLKYIRDSYPYAGLTVRQIDVRGSMRVINPAPDHALVKIGEPSGHYRNDGIRGEPNLWLDAAGTVYIKGGSRSISGFDIAEQFKVLGQAEAGHVVVFDEHTGAVQLCDRAYDRRVIGIVSTEPAFILGIDPAQIPITLCGRVPCNVDADIAPILVGDLLTTSPTRGYAQKMLAPDKAPGAIIGKALGSLDQGKGQILALVMMQ